ncbi:hypothetical protein H5410_043705 [Solanum commersonii]|uniref:Uncharacterized protein n=1 Tax=Solanum commersonii TaxID=4109 RepID=A0A9J5Y012_SOLCO|nr:hypothetical protein H5410_043705 [Solanum commersonii]
MLPGTFFKDSNLSILLEEFLYETWYDRVERGRKMMTRMSISRKTMEWLAFASRSIGDRKLKMRWKYRDRPWSSFAQGITTNRRYVSILKLQATKITRFINVKAQKALKMMHEKPRRVFHIRSCRK